VGNPAGQMRKLKTILTLMLLSCSTADKYELFNVETSDNFEFLDFEQINDIKTFNEKFWYSDSLNDDFFFIAKFDFKKGDFSNNSDKGIKLEGLPFRCLEFDCNRGYVQKLYLGNNYEALNDDMKLLNEQQIKELVKANILNFGKEPSLSDEPKQAIFRLYLKPEQRLDKLGRLFKIITDGYTELIDSKRIETKMTTEELIIEFPLRLQLRGGMIPRQLPNLIDIPDNGQIEEELPIDSIELNLK
jgi:hypothetical protein